MTNFPVQPLNALILGLEEALSNCKPLKHYLGYASKDADIWTSQALEEINFPRSGLNRTLVADPEKPSDIQRIFLTEHFKYGSPVNSERGRAISLVDTLKRMNDAAEILDHAILETQDSEISKRIAADARRFRYTHNLIRFIYHLARLRILEANKRSEAVQNEARSLREIGEALRIETEMPKFGYDDHGRGFRLYLNGLTATWFPKTYSQLMKKYFREGDIAESCG